MAFRGDSTATYTYASGSTGGTVNMGARNNYRYVNATNVYNKGKNDGITTHVDTYTFATNDTGGTKDLGVNHTYRYVNATNVYTKGKADGVTTHTGTYTFSEGSTGSTVDLGTTHTYRYVNASNVYNKGKADSGGISIKKNYYLVITPNTGIYTSPIQYNTRYKTSGWTNHFVNSADVSRIEAYLNMYNFGVNIASDGTISQTQIYNSTSTGWKNFDLTLYQSTYKYFSLCVYGDYNSLNVAFYQ